MTGASYIVVDITVKERAHAKTSLIDGPACILGVDVGVQLQTVRSAGIDCLQRLAAFLTTAAWYKMIKR